VEYIPAVCLFLSHSLPLSLTFGVISLHRPNLGSERHIPKPDPENKKKKVLVHRSVDTRMNAEDLKGWKYEPKVNFEGYEIEWVE
jgi:hypothetical protein